MEQHVVVIGGGISGLAAAHRLARAGVRTTLLEGSDQLGGLGTFFRHDDQWVERFYHCVMPTDSHLLPLLDEIGMGGQVRWRPTTMGMIVRKQRLPFSSAVDLLRFRPLTVPQRVRFGLVSVLLRRLGRGRDLDNLRTEDWLRGLYGPVIWERLFVPMFGSKFGPEFGDVPALYLWQRLGRESNVATRGYPIGGYQRVIEALRASIEDAGGAVRTGVPVQGLRDSGDRMRVRLADGAVIEADRVVSTVPLPQLAALADPALAARLPRSELRYQGVVNAVFFLRRPLDGHYWSAVLHSDTEFDGVIEMSALTGSQTYGGRHLVYVMHYTDRESALFAENPASIRARWTDQLIGLYRDLPLTPADIEHVEVFKAPFVEPVYPLGYAARKPPAEVPGTRVVLATTAQIYPNVTSWNSSVGLANDVVDHLLGQIRGPRVQAGSPRSVPITG